MGLSAAYRSVAINGRWWSSGDTLGSATNERQIGSHTVRAGRQAERTGPAPNQRRLPHGFWLKQRPLSGVSAIC